MQVVECRASSPEGIHVHLAGAAAGAAHVALSLSRFVPTAQNKHLSDGASAVTTAPAQGHQVFPLHPTAYSSGKRLSEETRYCLERRRLEQQVHLLYQLKTIVVCHTVIISVRSIALHSIAASECGQRGCMCRAKSARATNA